MPKDCESPENVCKNVCMSIFLRGDTDTFIRTVHNLPSCPQILSTTSTGILNCKSLVGHNILKLSRIEKYESLTLVIKCYYKLFLQMYVCLCVCSKVSFFILRSGLKMFESHCSKA